MSLDIDKFLTEVRARGSSDPMFGRMAIMFQQMADATNQVASLVGVDSSGHTSPPDAPAAIAVKANSGTVHVAITDPSQRNRALNYFVEASTDPSFPDSQTHVEHLGASRSKFFSLPGMDDNGDAQPWHFRTYSMALGSSQRSAHQTFGGTVTPTPVTVGGSAQLTPLASNGSGTTTQAGQGFGTSQFAKSSA